MTFPQYLQPWDNRYGEVGNIFLINFFDQRVLNTPVCIWLIPVLRCSSNRDHSPHRVSLVPSTQPMAGGQSIPSRWHALHSPDVRRCPDPVDTPKLLDLLREKDVKATFFVVGKRADQHPEIVRRAWVEGHLVANHTWSHNSLFCFLLPRRLRAEIERGTESIWRSCGLRP